MSDLVHVFAGTPLERNAEFRDEAGFAAAEQSNPRRRHLLLDDRGSALTESGPDALRWLGAGDRGRLFPDVCATYLGSDATGPVFFLAVDAVRAATAAAELGGTFLDLRGAGSRLPAFDAGVFACARALWHWQLRTRFCGHCGANVVLGALGHRGRCTNAACALEHFPRVDPAMIVVVTWRGRCLLGRQASWSERRYSTLAGFVEPGESIEDAVRREVFEEAGVRVGACRYHSSQPWPFPSSLMLGFTAEALDPAIRIGSELVDARWFAADELVAAVADRSIVLPPRVSVSHALIADWLRAQSGHELADLLTDEPWQVPRSA